MKKVTRLGLLVCLTMVFALLSSGMAFAASGTTCPLKNAGSQQIPVDQLQNSLGSGSCAGNTACAEKSCTDLNSCTLKNLCQNPLTCLLPNGATKAAADTNTSTCPKASKNTVTKIGNSTANANAVTKNANSTCPLSKILSLK
ncbi:hypothetical protein [Candidatus Formimonas warabiya]|uniref:Secreted protein n=1 Tax=Formimonas warabiya TaxID=1761012 RepID=A0A3G1KQ57_FORW1|nr:hypothetical protein [Candidatus Formimonas warabiya]ATW24567.1 hypothetical protein DCMF_07010 [Candidatus Formimonas warabiya]